MPVWTASLPFCKGHTGERDWLKDGINLQSFPRLCLLCLKSGKASKLLSVEDLKGCFYIRIFSLWFKYKPFESLLIIMSHSPPPRQQSAHTCRYTKCRIPLGGGCGHGLLETRKFQIKNMWSRLRYFLNLQKSVSYPISPKRLGDESKKGRV